MTRDSHLCAICAAEFGSSKDLVQHERSEHKHHAAPGEDGSTTRSDQESSEPVRQNREFSRRNFE